MPTIWDFLYQLAILVMGIVIGSYVYTKFTLKQIVKNELRGILKDISETLNKDGETKERLKEVIDTVMDEIKIKGNEIAIELAKNIKKEFFTAEDVEVPSSLRKFMDDEKQAK